jgi:sugar lactone lactonase YvrE
MRRILGIVAAFAAASLHAQSITTIAGGGSDDGQAATAIPISSPRGIAVDAGGNIYFAEGAGRVRRVDAASGVVKTIAGNGAAGLSGDGALAVGATLNNPEGIVFDSSGNLYIADNANNRVRRIDAKSGIITTYAGGGTPATGIGDGGVATSAILSGPTSLAIDRGFLYVTESAFDSNRVRRIDLATNIINTFDAGQLNAPFGIVIDAAGNIFIADIGSGLVRRIDAQTKAIDTYAGGGNPADGIGDNLPATQAKLGSPTGIAFDKDGNLLISCVDTGSMRKVDKTTKIITTFASTVYLPSFIATDSHGVLWSSDDEIVYRVAGDGSLTPLAGGGTFIGDGRVATAAILQEPDGIALAANGDLYIADAGHNVLRRVTASSGRISTIAGQPGRVYAPPEQEGGDATSAVIGFPRDVAIDSTGALYVADLNNERIWRIDAARKITTYAGGGTASTRGDWRSMHRTISIGSATTRSTASTRRRRRSRSSRGRPTRASAATAGRRRRRSSTRPEAWRSTPTETCSSPTTRTGASGRSIAPGRSRHTRAATIRRSATTVPRLPRKSVRGGSPFRNGRAISSSPTDRSIACGASARRRKSSQRLPARRRSTPRAISPATAGARPLRN